MRLGTTAGRVIFGVQEPQRAPMGEDQSKEETDTAERDPACELHRDAVPEVPSSVCTGPEKLSGNLLGKRKWNSSARQ